MTETRAKIHEQSVNKMSVDKGGMKGKRRKQFYSINMFQGNA